MEATKHGAGQKLGKRALLADCITQVMVASTPDGIEVAFQAGLVRLGEAYGSYWVDGYQRASTKLRWEGANVRGLQLADTMDAGRLLPRLGARRRLTINGETYSVGYGGNSTGERYAWTYAKDWARGRLLDAGLPEPTVTAVLEWWAWPHRALRILAGIDLSAALTRAEG